MRIIIIEDCAYKIREKEYNILNGYNLELKNNKTNYKMCCSITDKIQRHIDENISKYKKLGYIDFDFRQ